MRKILSSNLSVSGLRQLKKQIKDYMKQIELRNDEFVKRLAECGLMVASVTLKTEGSGDSSREGTFEIRTDSSGAISSASLYLTGRDVLFWEFGAGVHYNGPTSPNPKAGEFGFGIGTYGKGQGMNDYWRYYDGKWKTSHGTQATMPMYKADLEMIEEVGRIAKEVFEI